jgi:hypothetical protein
MLSKGILIVINRPIVAVADPKREILHFSRVKVAHRDADTWFQPKVEVDAEHCFGVVKLLSLGTRSQQKESELVIQLDKGVEFGPELIAGAAILLSEE